MSILSYLLGEPKDEDLGIEVTDWQSFKMPIYSAPEVVPAETEEKIKNFTFEEVKESRFHSTVRRNYFTATGIYACSGSFSSGARFICSG